MKIGIIREGKNPPDNRVPLTPEQCAVIKYSFPVEIVVQTSPSRCFTDEEYRKSGVTITDELTECDVLLGVKEVPIPSLIPLKTYFFFSHTIKKQPYNRDLLRAVLAKKIRLIDYEVLTNNKKARLIAFGKFAGMVGAHNALWTYAQRTKAFPLGRMKDAKDYATIKETYKNIDFPSIKIVLTGGGRVANGAAQVLEDMGIQKVKPADFLNKSYKHAVFTQLDCDDYAERIDGTPFKMQHFFKNPQLYQSKFESYTKVSDIMINGIFWDKKAPAFFTKDDMKKDDFNIKVIADITCDIAPESSIPSTLYATTIAKPVFGYDPHQEKAVSPYQPHTIDVMSIDNLPNELSRDASQSFGEQFIQHIMPELLDFRTSNIIQRATIAENGYLGKHFEYLTDYVS